MDCSDFIASEMIFLGQVVRGAALALAAGGILG
jgi:hypothetical protein